MFCKYNKAFQTHFSGEQKSEKSQISWLKKYQVLSENKFPFKFTNVSEDNQATFDPWEWASLSEFSISVTQLWAWVRY